MPDHWMRDFLGIRCCRGIRFLPGQPVMKNVVTFKIFFQLIELL